MDKAPPLQGRAVYSELFFEHLFDFQERSEQFQSSKPEKFMKFLVLTVKKDEN